MLSPSRNIVHHSANDIVNCALCTFKFRVGGLKFTSFFHEMTIITAISLFQSCKPITGRNFPVSRRQTFILCGCSAIRQDAHLNFDVGFNLHKLAPRRGDGGTFWESYGDALLVDRAQRSTCRLFSFFLIFKELERNLSIQFNMAARLHFNFPRKLPQFCSRTRRKRSKHLRINWTNTFHRSMFL